MIMDVERETTVSGYESFGFALALTLVVQSSVRPVNFEILKAIVNIKATHFSLNFIKLKAFSNFCATRLIRAHIL